MSTRSTTPSAAAKHGATRRVDGGLTPQEAMVAQLLLQGKTVAVVAAQLYPDTAPANGQRNVRRLRAAAIKHGAVVEQPPPRTPQDAGGQFTKARPKGRVRSIITTDGRAVTGRIRVDSVEDDPQGRVAREIERRREHAERTGAGRGGLGKHYEAGDLERDPDTGQPTGRVLIGSAQGEAAPMHALDAYSPLSADDLARARGATHKIVLRDDDTQEVHAL